MQSVASFLEQLEYTVKNISLFEQAFTHKSFSGTHNERLEFLGDALLGVIIGEALFKQFPEKREGELSRYRAELVKGETLADIAKELELGKFIRLGAGEEKSGGKERISILANAVEALIGAVYLDSDFLQCSHVTLNIFSNRLAKVESKAERKDAKTALQELLQARQMELPNYSLEQVTGEHHQQNFQICCSVDSFQRSVISQGKSKKIAEQGAAAAMLELLKKDNLL